MQNLKHVEIRLHSWAGRCQLWLCWTQLCATKTFGEKDCDVLPKSSVQIPGFPSFSDLIFLSLLGGDWWIRVVDLRKGLCTKDQWTNATCLGGGDLHHRCAVSHSDVTTGHPTGKVSGDPDHSQPQALHISCEWKDVLRDSTELRGNVSWYCTMGRHHLQIRCLFLFLTSSQNWICLQLQPDIEFFCHLCSEVFCLFVLCVCVCFCLWFLGRARL